MIDHVRETTADAFDQMADEFAALAEASSTFDQCVRYRDLEQSYRLRAAEERARQLSRLRHSGGGAGTSAAA